MGIWDEVQELVKAGKTGFQLNLTPGLEIRDKRERGRPPTRDIRRPYIEYRDPRVAKTNGRKRPRCIRRDCDTYLKKDDVLVCSDECEQLVRETMLQTLKYLDLRQEIQNGLSIEQSASGSHRKPRKRTRGQIPRRESVSRVIGTVRPSQRHLGRGESNRGRNGSGNSKKPDESRVDPIYAAITSTGP